MLVVIALGGNALLRRGEPLTAENQRANTKIAAEAIADVIRAGHRVVIAHGNGPQVGLLALQGAAYKPDEAYPLDVLGAETEGMIGYLIEQELENALPKGARVVTLLTQIEVDAHDPAFGTPTKPVGPVYDKAAVDTLSTKQGWVFVKDGEQYRRVVASPVPQAIPDTGIIRLLVDVGVTVICAGGGGIPVIRQKNGGLIGVEAVIDKDLASALLAKGLNADALLLLTDVDGVYQNWDQPNQRKIDHASPHDLTASAFPAGSMGPKVIAACDFASDPGRMSGIGALKDALKILQGKAGTVITSDAIK